MRNEPGFWRRVCFELKILSTFLPLLYLEQSRIRWAQRTSSLSMSTLSLLYEEFVKGFPHQRSLGMLKLVPNIQNDEVVQLEMTRDLVRSLVQA
jgi:hypothetical protein